MIDFTGSQRVVEDPEPADTGRRARREPDDSAATPRSRLRVGWRKGSHVDEELWPVEAFGGVSDEQFWDDLATDKPLTTTARTAQPDTAAKRRPPNAGPGTHPQPRLGPDDRTAVQPVQPVQPGAQPSATSPVATRSYAAVTQPSPIASQPVRPAHQPAESRGRSRTSADEDPLTSPAYSLRPRGGVNGRAYSASRRDADLTRGQHEAAAGQETQAFSRADTQAASGGYPNGVPPFRQFDRPSHSGNGGRGRPDPLRSDGHRSDPLRSDLLRPDPLRSDLLRPDPLRSDLLRPDPLRPGSGYGGTDPYSPYPYPQQPYGEPAQPMNTPPHGERYGYGNPVSQRGPAGDPQRANGGWSPGQVGGNGGSWGSRAAYPPANGPRGPYDPRGYDRRLTSRPGLEALRRPVGFAWRRGNRDGLPRQAPADPDPQAGGRHDGTAAVLSPAPAGRLPSLGAGAVLPDADRVARRVAGHRQPQVTLGIRLGGHLAAGLREPRQGLVDVAHVRCRERHRPPRQPAGLP